MIPYSESMSSSRVNVEIWLNEPITPFFIGKNSLAVKLLSAPHFCKMKSLDEFSFWSITLCYFISFTSMKETLTHRLNSSKTNPPDESSIVNVLSDLKWPCSQISPSIFLKYLQNPLRVRCERESMFGTVNIPTIFSSFSSCDFRTLKISASSSISFANVCYHKLWSITPFWYLKTCLREVGVFAYSNKGLRISCMSEPGS